MHLTKTENTKLTVLPLYSSLCIFMGLAAGYTVFTKTHECSRALKWYGICAQPVHNLMHLKSFARLFAVIINGDV